MSRFAEKFEYPELRKFNWKLCTLYMYGMSGFIEKLNIQNWKNSTRNCFHYICTECLDLQKTEYPELRKFNGKLFTLYMCGRSCFGEKLNIQNYENSLGNCVHYIFTERLDFRKFDYPELWKFNWKLCTLYMYGMSRFAEKLNFQNRVIWMGNCIHNM